MITYKFRCKVTEPLILVKKEKTEQSTETLDYIPGNTFRGIVAADLFANKDDSQKIDDVLFNGKVQFGDAHLVIKDQRSYQIPATIYKDGEGKLFNYHWLTDNDLKTLKKLKQYRRGYFIASDDNIVIKNIEVGDRMKGSRNIENRSSEKTGLFMYRYIKKGQVFEFEVKSDDNNHFEIIKELLDKKIKFFGKAKGAEFGGAIKIEFKEEEPSQKKVTTKGTILYAESNLCFLNKYGEFTATPSAEQLTGIKGIVIDWEKSQLRFRTFMPYNNFRQNWDAERLIIEKGSVFVFKKVDENDKSEIEFNADFLNKGIGCFLTEGYGRVLVNPAFLLEREVAFVPMTGPTNKESDEIASENQKTDPTNDVSDNEILNYLEDKYKETRLNSLIQEKVDGFIKSKSFTEKITPTQWSNIFTATTQATLQAKNENKDFNILNNLLFNIDNGICVSGLNNPWKGSGEKLLKAFLEDFGDKEKVLAIRILSKKMRIKQKSNKSNAEKVVL